MANLTEDQKATAAEILTLIADIAITDPVPTRKLVYYYCMGYIDARSGEPEYINTHVFCSAFCTVYCAGYLVGTT